MIGGHGNHLIDSDPGTDWRSPLFDDEEPFSSVIEEKFWDEDLEEFRFDKKTDLPSVSVDINTLLSYIEQQVHMSPIDMSKVKIIKNHADEVVIEYIESETEKELYEMYYD